jgi:PAS domain-containing protein
MRKKEQSRICKMGRMFFLLIVIVDCLFLVTDGYINSSKPIIKANSDIVLNNALIKFQTTNTAVANVVSYDIFQQTFFKKAAFVAIGVLVIILIINLLMLSNGQFMGIKFKKRNSRFDPNDFKLESFTTIVENCSDAFLLFDDDGRILYGNSALKKIMPVNTLENDNDIFIDHIYSDDIEKFKIECSNLRIGEEANLKFRLINKDKSIVKIGALISNRMLNHNTKAYIANISCVS